MYETLTEYFVAGDNVGTETAKYPTYPLEFEGVAYGVGSGDGASAGLPKGIGPSGDRTKSVPKTEPPEKITSPKSTGTFFAPGIG